MLFMAVLAAVAGLEQAPQVPPPAPTAPSPAAPPEVSPVLVSPPKTPPEPVWAKKLNLDPKGSYARSAEPYLRQRPENGCKVMAGGAASPSGRRQGAAGGLVCVKRF